jgi:nucleotide-binding universal stress UspA family protein
MSRVIAALDNSPAASPVLVTARAFAALLGADVDPIHVLGDGGVDGDGDGVAEWAAQENGLSLHSIPGPLIDGLVQVGLANDVAAMVLGARGTAAGPRPMGSTALAVATSLTKPVVVVPPDARVANTIRRVLVPVEGGPSADGMPRLIAELVHHAQPDIIAVYVNPETDLPPFTDQPQHEHGAWTHEFIRRYCDSLLGTLRMHTRVGRPEDLVPLVAEEVDADLIALSWSQDLDQGRAPVVRAVLERFRRPTMLVPVAH